MPTDNLEIPGVFKITVESDDLLITRIDRVSDIEYDIKIKKTGRGKL